MERNFIDDGPSADAHDPGNTGPLRSPGHGTGTLSILAGAHFQFGQDGYQFDDDLGGTQIHRPGTIIGKALEPLDKGTGEILVLLSLQ